MAGWQYLDFDVAVYQIIHILAAGEPFEVHLHTHSVRLDNLPCREITAAYISHLPLPD
jgi:hypothetical protein